MSARNITPLQLAMEALTFTLRTYQELSGLPEDSDPELVEETIEGKLREADRLRARVAELEAREGRVREVIHEFAGGAYEGHRNWYAIRALRAALDGSEPKR